MKKITELTLNEIKAKNLDLVIYGAGGVGSVCLERLMYMGIPVKCVAVTNLENNPLSLNGKRVHGIEQAIKKYGEFIVLVCVLERKQKMIVETLIQKGVPEDSIYLMTDKLYKEWEQKNQEEMLDCKQIIYYKRYVEPYTKTLNKISAEKNLSYEEMREFIEKELNIFETSDVCMARLVVVLSTKCSLRCKECNNLIPHFNPQKDLDESRIIESLETITQNVGKLLKCELLGGDPFLAKNLKKVLEYTLDNDKIESVEITTNGTILPQESLLRLLQNSKVIVRISDYGSLVDKSKVINYLIENNIRYKVLETDKWVSPGGINKRDKDIETLRREYARCAPGYICKTLFEDKIFACARAASLYALGYMKEPESIHLNENFKPEYLKKFLLRDFSIACDYCDMASDNATYIDPAEQLTFGVKEIDVCKGTYCK